MVGHVIRRATGQWNVGGGWRIVCTDSRRVCGEGYNKHLREVDEHGVEVGALREGDEEQTPPRDQQQRVGERRAEGDQLEGGKEDGDQRHPARDRQLDRVAHLKCSLLLAFVCLCVCVLACWRVGRGVC